MKKIIFSIIAIIFASIMYNPQYWGWHFWAKWKMPYSKELFILPNQLTIPHAQHKKTNWEVIDLWGSSGDSILNSSESPFSNILIKARDRPSCSLSIDNFLTKG